MIIFRQTFPTQGRLIQASLLISPDKAIDNLFYNFKSQSRVLFIPLAWLLEVMQ